MTSNAFVTSPSDIEATRKPLDISRAVTVGRSKTEHFVEIHYKGSTLSFNSLVAAHYGMARILVNGQHWVEDAGISYNEEMQQWWMQVNGKGIQFDTYTEMINEAAGLWLS